MKSFCHITSKKTRLSISTINSVRFLLSFTNTKLSCGFQHPVIGSIFYIFLSFPILFQNPQIFCCIRLFEIGGQCNAGLIVVLSWALFFFFDAVVEHNVLLETHCLCGPLPTKNYVLFLKMFCAVKVNNASRILHFIALINIIYFCIIH